jgi:hypothetical protein
MSSDRSVAALLRDSAAVITAFTVLLFLWGYSFDAFRPLNQSVPGLFRPEVSMEERITTGGVLALLIFAPLSVGLYAMDVVASHRLSKRVRALHDKDVAHRLVLYVLFLLLSVGVVQGTSLATDRLVRKFVVVEDVTLRSGQSGALYRGLYCIGKRGGAYIFVDRLDTPSSKVYLLQEEEIGSMVFGYGPLADLKR